MNKYCAAILADSPAKRRFYQSLVQGLGWPLLFVGDPSQMHGVQPLAAIFWLVDLADAEQQPDWLFEHPAVLFYEGELPEPASLDAERFRRRLLANLERLRIPATPDAYADAPALALGKRQQATAASDVRLVCVLLASTGGPSAVTQFLRRLPAGMPVSFIYGQHIDDSGWRLLPQMLNHKSMVQAQALTGEQALRAGRLYVAPLNRPIDFTRAGQLTLGRETVSGGGYRPNLNQLLSRCVQQYGRRCLAIVFSGMDEDGSQGAAELVAAGGQVWAQTPDSAAQRSMPEALIKRQLTHFVGSPYQLARQLVLSIPQQ